MTWTDTRDLKKNIHELLAANAVKAAVQTSTPKPAGLKQADLAQLMKTAELNSDLPTGGLKSNAITWANLKDKVRRAAGLHCFYLNCYLFIFSFY